MSGFPHTAYLYVSVLTEIALLAGCIFLFQRSRRIREMRDRQMREKEVLLGFLHDVGEVFADVESLDLNRLLERVLYYAMRTSHAGAGVVYMMDQENSVLRARAVAGIMPPLAGDIQADELETAVSKSQHLERLVMTQTIPRGRGMVGEVAAFNAPILIPDAERDPRVPRYHIDFLKIRSILLVPLRYQQHALGVMAVINRIDGEPFNHEHQNLLQSLADQASVTVHYLGLREALDAKRRIDHDLNVARHIQANLLPRQIPDVPGFEIGAFNIPALQIGGDYYDILWLDENHIGVAIADVSGKGVSGAILMSSCRSILRAQAPQCLSPAEVLKSLNLVMSEDVSEDMFVSMLYLVLDTRTHKIRMARAGHEKPLWFRSRSGDFDWVDSPGIAIGLSDVDVFDEMLKEITIELEPGDYLLLYTDGITEAMNAGSDEWGKENFLDSIRTSAPGGVRQMLSTVRQRIKRFMGDRQQYDDMTLVAVHATETTTPEGTTS